MGSKNFWSEYKKTKKSEAVNAAKSLFSSRKIENVKMTDIAEAIGIGVASLYRYFATKNALAIAVGVSYWEDIKAEFNPRFDSAEFQNASGIGKISFILDLYSELLKKHRDFLLYISDFDGYCVKQKITKKELSEYQDSIADFYIPYKTAIECGERDGTVKTDDPLVTYYAVNHAMLSMLIKIAEGEILFQDERYADEIDVMKKIILSYFKK